MLGSKLPKDFQNFSTIKPSARRHPLVRAVAEKKRQTLINEVSTIGFHVERWPLPRVVRAAIAQWEQRGADRGEYGRYGADADEATKDRWTVNFIRHNLVSIGSGQHLPLLRGQTGKYQALATLEHKIYETIAEVYPDLASAAFQQADRLWGRTTPNLDAQTTSASPDAQVSKEPGDQELTRPASANAVALFRERTHHLPTATEAERFLVQRIGQDVFRRTLLEFWSGRCAINGLDQPELLRASHLKPWAACTTDAERLDPYNGLLLSVHWDAAFDSGLATLEEDGTLLLSDQLTLSARQLLIPNSKSPTRVLNLHEAHLPFIRYHRQHVWRSL